MEVLTKLKTIKQGDYTYNLMSDDFVHINNHKTNCNSVIVPLSSILDLVGNEIKAMAAKELAGIFHDGENRIEIAMETCEEYAEKLLSKQC